RILILNHVCATPGASQWRLHHASLGTKRAAASREEVLPLISGLVCDPLSPFLKCKPNPWKPRHHVIRVRETVQFFNVPDIKEAAFMISALCLHLEAHGYEPSDIAVLVDAAPGTLWSLIGEAEGEAKAKGFHAAEALGKAQAEEDPLKSDLTITVQRGRLPTGHVAAIVDFGTSGRLADRRKVLPAQKTGMSLTLPLNVRLAKGHCFQCHDDLEQEHDIERRTEVSHSNTESLPVRFTFPSFEEMTTGSRVIRPRVTIVCGVTEIEDFYVPALLPGSAEKVVILADSLNPHQASSTWKHLLDSKHFKVHDLVFQYFQSQEICDLLSPFLKSSLVSRKPLQRVNGIVETVQFFNIPDIIEAAFMISRVCVHLQAHNYESSDVAVLVLSPRKDAMKALKFALSQQGCRFSVYTAKAFYPKRCKIGLVYLGLGSLGTQFAAALSRVSFAVYGFGDFSKIDESCQNVLNTAKARTGHLFCGRLSLTCVCHPGRVISVASRQDFEAKLHGDGFCRDPSSGILKCGHACEFVDQGWRQVASLLRDCAALVV
ncbi:hypothetical protein HPB47_010962, partial [Ixodes persulcatus]